MRKPLIVISYQYTLGINTTKKIEFTYDKNSWVRRNYP